MSFLLPLLLSSASVASPGSTDVDSATPLIARVTTAVAPAVVPAHLGQATVAGRSVSLEAPRVTLDPGEGAELSGALVQLTWTGAADDVTVLAGKTLLTEVGAGMFVLPEQVPAQLELVAWLDGKPVDIRIVRIESGDLY